MISETIRNLFPNDLQKITYIGDLPTDKNECVSLMEMGGPHGAYFNYDKLNEPYMKILVRDSEYIHGRTCAERIKELLTSYAQSQYISVILRTDVSYLGRDDKRRHTWHLIYKIFY